jgi:hypothetical protein
VAVEFCAHLEDYGDQYVIAEAAYRQMLGLLDVVLKEERADRRNVEHLEDAVEEWEREVRYLRDLFLIYVRRGDIELPRSPDADDEPAPPASRENGSSGDDQGDSVCTVCGAPVPRLRWQEWRVDADRASYRGAPFLDVREPEPAA